MNIVVLDAHTTNPGDLSWGALQALGPCRIYDRTPQDKAIECAAGAEILLTNKTVLSAEVLEQLPGLKYIGVLATGYNVVDVAAAAGRGIVVTNVPAYSTASVAQMVFAHVLNLCHRVETHSAGVHQGRWTAAEDFCYADHPQTELVGRTMGIVGFGRIGRAVANLAAAFGMDVLAVSRSRPDDLPEGVTLIDLADLLSRSDVISLHCPLTEATEGLIGREQLAAMKPTAWLINTGRGPLIDEAAVAEALAAGEIAAAAVDVLSAEPPRPDNPLLGAPNCFITPHIAWATRAARQRLLNTAVENVRAYLAGRPVNVVGG